MLLKRWRYREEDWPEAVKHEVNPTVRDLLHRADAFNSSAVYKMESWEPQVRRRGSRHVCEPEGLEGWHSLGQHLLASARTIALPAPGRL